MQILDKVVLIDHGRQVWPTRPIRTIAIKEVEDCSLSTVDINYVVRHELRLGCNTMVTHSQKKDPGYMDHNRRKVTAMIAETLYGEVCQDLREIMIYVYETYGDRDLEEKLNQLYRKMRP
jgi:hypothetical protein